MSIKINKAISSFAHDGKLEVLKALKVYLDEKMDDADAVTDLIEKFTLSLEKKEVKVGKVKVDKGDKPKRTRKATYYNYWLGQRLKTFAAEQKDVEDDEKVGKGG